LAHDVKELNHAISLIGRGEEMAFEDYITDDNLLGFDNKYRLVNVAAQRARQINEGVEVYVRTQSKHPLQIALEEIAAGFVDFDQTEEIEDIESIESEEELISFDEMINVDADFDFDDEEAFDLEPMDFEDEFTNEEDFEIVEE
jgi:DNA-directed RNA polymerase omega subunit